MSKTKSLISFCCRQVYRLFNSQYSLYLKIDECVVLLKVKWIQISRGLTVEFVANESATVNWKKISTVKY